MVAVLAPRARRTRNDRPFKRWIQAELDTSGLSTSAFAEKAGIGHQTLIAWLESDQAVTRGSARRVAESLGKDLDEILELAGHGRELPAERYPEVEQHSRTPEETAAAQAEARESIDTIRARIRARMREIEDELDRLTGPDATD
jgi:transcriptional regulator with XRE-family HTH domain